ncbi:hypothetical protein [Rhodococcus artemisiae]|uniref:Uncharacterized protein n=1 Tax=Rhodococcus artemisiae TaxID=714159 RepID=A0ABU7LBM8_9NOCA|nr:hypothetical protein [Rhodococcus artemisiae]MEE2058944.1 hypothetical protein [Rhodococcus artemisiae]
MTTIHPPLVIHDDRVLWRFKAGIRLREVESGRTFLTTITPGRLWHGETPCSIDDLELPVEVIE